MQDHDYTDGEDRPIPKSEASPAGAPATPAERLRPPDAQKTPEVVMEEDTPTEVQEEQETTDPEQKVIQENPAEGDDPEAMLTEIEEGPEGGSPERMEVAKLDTASMRESFSDDLEKIEDPDVEPDVQDAMPERSPAISNPDPFYRAPKPTASPPLVAVPITRPTPAAVPMPEGSVPTEELKGEADLAAFSPSRRINAMSGKLSNKGKNGVDAEATPVGEYKKAVSRAIEKRWHYLRLERESFVTYSSLKMRFRVNSSGRVSGLRIVHDDASAVVKEFSLTAVLTARIPPMSPEVAEVFGNDDLDVTYDIIIF